MTLDLGMMFPQHRWNFIVAKRKLHKTAAVVKAAKHHVVQHLLRSPENWNHSRPYMPQNVAWIWAFRVAASDSSKPPILIVPAYWIGPGTKGSGFCMVKCSLATSGPSEKPIQQYKQYENMNTLALWELSCQLCRLHLWFFLAVDKVDKARGHPHEIRVPPLASDIDP